MLRRCGRVLMRPLPGYCMRGHTASNAGCRQHGRASGGGVALPRQKHLYRLSSEALQQTRARVRRRHHRDVLQQRVTVATNAQHTARARVRRAYAATAEGLMYSGATALRNSSRSDDTQPTRAAQRTAQLSAARQLLHTQEALRRDGKRDRGRRLDAFRALKRWGA